MKFSKSKAVTAAACSVMLVGTGVAVVAPVVAGTVDNGQAQAVQNADSAAQGIVNVQGVEGTFEYTQDAITPNDKISQAFVKSGASVCATTPNALAAVSPDEVTVSGDDSAITLADAAGDVEEGSFILACACSSNLAGGGIVANAQVTGMPVAQIASAI